LTNPNTTFRPAPAAADALIESVVTQ
jgi:hypothetical protein